MTPQHVFVGYLSVIVLVIAFEAKEVGISSRVKRFWGRHGETNIAGLFPVRTIQVMLPRGLGVNNNPPSDAEILAAVSSANSNGIRSDQLQVVWSTRNSALISAKANNLYGSFTVFFN